MLNKDEYDWHETGLPHDFGTADGEHFLWAKIMVVKRSERRYKEEKPRELLDTVISELREGYQSLVVKQRALGVPANVAMRDLRAPFDIWIEALEKHKQKWVENWSGVSRHAVPEDWDFEKAFDEEIARVKGEKEAEAA